MAEAFGYWTVLGPAPSIPSKHGAIKHVRCRCKCGTERAVSLRNLKAGMSKSCGCFKAKRTSQVKTRHGHARKGATSREFQTWQAMLARCGRPTHVSFPNYGGRGIRVCDRWRAFEAFFTDMGPRPSSNHSLDRIDVEGNYEPANCRWATKREQRLNQRPRLRLDQYSDNDLISELERRGFRATRAT